VFLYAFLVVFNLFVDYVLVFLYAFLGASPFDLMLFVTFSAVAGAPRTGALTPGGKSPARAWNP
jgi:hypothetical protein